MGDVATSHTLFELELWTVKLNLLSFYVYTHYY